jgi:hypothetical protein
MDEGSHMLVCAMDGKLSYGGGFTSTERYLKIEPFTQARLVVMLAADDMAHADELLREIRAQKLSQPLSFPDLFQRLGDARTAVINRLASAGLPPGLDLARFYAEGRKLLSPAAYETIFDRLDKFRLRCDLLVVGFDSIDLPHIVSVGEDPPQEHDREAFCAIGSGRYLADSILSAYDHMINAGWRETAYRVRAAKRAAERTQGVGRMTFMIALSLDGQRFFPGGDLDALIDDYGLLPPPKQWPEIRDKLVPLIPKGEPALRW